ERLEHADEDAAAAVGHETRDERFRSRARDEPAGRPAGKRIAIGIDSRSVDLPTPLPRREQAACAVGADVGATADAERLALRGPARGPRPGGRQVLDPHTAAD